MKETLQNEDEKNPFIFLDLSLLFKESSFENVQRSSLKGQTFKGKEVTNCSPHLKYI